MRDHENVNPFVLARLTSGTLILVVRGGAASLPTTQTQSKRLDHHHRKVSILCHPKDQWYEVNCIVLFE